MPSTTTLRVARMMTRGYFPSHRLLPSIISEKLPISSDTGTQILQQNAVSSTGT